MTIKIIIKIGKIIQRDKTSSQIAAQTAIREKRQSICQKRANKLRT